MANGTTRLAQAKMAIKKEAATSEHSEMIAIADNKKKGAQDAIPLKAGKK